MKKAWIWTFGVILLSFVTLAQAILSPSLALKYSQLPILHEGRMKPLDTMARHLLLVSRGKQTVTWKNKSISPQQWILDVTYHPDLADQYPIFRVDDPTILGMLGVELGKKRYFSFIELAPYLAMIQQQFQAVEPVPVAERGRFQKAIIQLGTNILTYSQVRLYFLSSALPYSMLSSKIDRVLYDFSRQADGSAWKIKLEWGFNQWAPFYYGMIINVLVFIGVLGVWLSRRFEWLPALYGALWGSLIIHTSGIVIRMLLVGRPPVTNLYTSAIFVGWVAMVAGLIFEKYLKQGVGILISALIGFLTLIVAHHLSLQGDTLEMMQAVLDSNFWLSTHVVVVTMGYSATFFSGFLAYIYIFKGVFFRSFSSSDQKRLVSMVYAALCFGLLFSFTGTMLGGIWADQSWGRFWGWDPKENGALMIVLWVAAVLHARWAGWIEARGLMLMAVLGNIVTSFSWFGVNMLGVGLHSYGFMEQTFFGLVVFVFIQLVVFWIGLLPIRYWKGLSHD